MDALPTPTELFLPRTRGPWSAPASFARPLVRGPVRTSTRADCAARRHLRRALWVVLCVAAVLAGMGVQSLYTADLAERLAQAQARVNDLDQNLQTLRAQASTHDDVESLRSVMGHGFDGTAARVSAVESGSVAPVVSRVAKSVALIQARYVLIDPPTGRPLRLVLVKGKPQMGADNEPRLTLSGQGPIYMFRSTGTAFVVDAQGTLVTNRHVALPWEQGVAMQAMQSFGVRPMVLELRGFLPGTVEPFAVSVAGVSATHDLALLRGSGAALTAEPLTMSTLPPSPGDAVLVLGYPTGLTALIARADKRFVSGLRQQADMNDQKAADALAQAGLIQPLVSRGIVAQVSAAAVVHDAQTTFGGSGGPVLNLRGEVLAINRAILAGFGGANMGVPVGMASELMQAESEARKKAEQP
ncbi:serine protease [Rhodoferax saidenbachensis]|uniref:serine protease n=1 Tax=Rhodoferax saidenbachensis TaxID=1484693 RepID=UPI00286C9149|nr:serine protease [Rhodoferax saidenbachensis]